MSAVHVLVLSDPPPADKVRVDVKGFRKVVSPGEKQYVDSDVADAMLDLAYRGRKLFRRIEMIETNQGG